LISLGLEQPEAHAVAAIFENPDTAIEINNRLPILGQSQPGVGAPADWDQVTQINGANPVSVDTTSEIWASDADTSEIAQRGAQVASLILAINQADDKGALQLGARGFGNGSILAGLSETDLTAIATLTEADIEAANGDVAQALEELGLAPAEIEQVMLLMNNAPTVELLNNDVNAQALPQDETPAELEREAYYHSTDIDPQNPENAWSKPFEDLIDEELNTRITDINGLIKRMITYKHGMLAMGSSATPEFREIYDTANLGAGGLNVDALSDLSNEEVHTQFQEITAERIELSGGLENLMRELGYEEDEIQAFKTVLENPATAKLIDDRLPTLFNTQKDIDWSAAQADPTLESWRDGTTRVGTVLGILQEVQELNTTVNDANASPEAKALAQGAIGALTAGSNISVSTVLGFRYK
jgi:hypothetical protein